MKILQIIITLISIIGLVLYFQFLSDKGGLVLISVAVLAEVIILIVSSIEKNKRE